MPVVPKPDDAEPLFGNGALIVFGAKRPVPHKRKAEKLNGSQTATPPASSRRTANRT
jgi:hypothetical protein